MTDKLHMPVLLQEVLAGTQPQPGEVVVDATLGLGGHAARFLDAIGDTGQLIGLDADERNLALARTRLAGHATLTTHHINFRDMATQLAPASADIILMDLGISSQHLDDAARGFSYRHDALLDMRLDATTGQSAAEFIAQSSVDELADVLYQYGEIRSSRKLAALLKESARLETTTQLRELVEEAGMGRVLTQTFQALRIAVNDELGALRDGLVAAVQTLRPGGRLAVISFHSLEDRLVKQYFRAEKGTMLEIVTKKPIAPTSEEIADNPRARSAKLRIAKKVDSIQ